jgi:phasin
MNDIKSIQIPEELRDFAEKSVDQAQKVFENMIEAAQKALDAGKSQPLAAPVVDSIRSSLDFTDKNMKAAFDHTKKMMRAKDMPEAMQLQMEFVKSQFTAFQGQMTKLAGAAGAEVEKAKKAVASEARSLGNAA